MTDAGSPGRSRRWRAVAWTIAVPAVVAGAVWIEVATYHRDDVAAVGVCEDVTSGLRVADQRCATGRPGERWMYYRTGSSAPALGGSATGGSPTPPSGIAPRGGESDAGGEVSEDAPSGSSGSSGSGGEEGGEEGGSSGGGSSGSSGGSGGGGGSGGEGGGE